MNTLKFPIYEFRPIYFDVPLMRYNNGNWIEDDGEYDLAFATNGVGAPIAYYVSMPYNDNQLWSWVKDGRWGGYVSDHPDGNAWHYMSKDGLDISGKRWDRDKHPNEMAGRVAMDYLCKKHSCANGRGVEFHIGDPYIIQGLLREVETKKIVEFPKIFSCCRCRKNFTMSELNMEKQYA